MVTGSRIRRKDLNTPAPVTVIGHDQIMASGKITIAEYLQILPEQGNSLNQNANNGGDGTTTVNLRGLDSSRGARTLVLLNGRRMITGGPGANNFVDLGTIPTAAIERIEVLKDGASAIYGADAIAGVVNIITRKNFNGSEAVVNWGISSRNDANTTDIGVTAGTTGEKTNALLSVSYYDQKQVLSRARPWATNALSYDYIAGVSTPGGSGTLPIPKAPTGAHRGQTTGLDPNSLLYKLNFRCDPSGTTPTACPSTYILDPTDPLGWRGATGNDVYNFAAENYMVTPQNRVGLFGTADSKIGDAARVYFEGSYVNRQQWSALAPEPMWGTVYYGLRMSQASMYNPFGVDMDFRRRLVEADRRQENRENDTFRGVAGFDGTLSDTFGPLKGWYWDVSFNYGRDVGSDTFHGNLNVNQIRAAIGPSRIDPATGAPTCYTDGNFTTPIAGCVPINLFGAPGSVTPDQIAALTFVGPSKGVNQQAITSATVQGELFQLAADRASQLLVGVEYRKYEGSNIPDPFTVFGYTSGQQSAPIGGAYDAKDAFAELNIPIVSGMQGIEDLEANVAARVFKYNLFSQDQAYKFGIRYKPIRDVTLRGTYATAYRAPSISEIYGGTGLSADTASDPCDDYTNLNQAQIDRCHAGGGPAAVAGPGAAGVGVGSGQTQLTTVIGSNGNLKPETAKTFTFGVVYTPEYVKGLSLTLDFYDIRMTSPIARDGAQIIVNSCILGGVQTACDRITRDPADGTFIQATDLLANQGKDEAQGIDAAARYNFNTPYGRFGLGVDSTFLLKRDQTKSTSLNSVVVKGKNTYDLGVNPGVKFNAGVQYFYANANAGLFARYIGGYKECAGTATGLSYGTDCVFAGQYSHDVPATTTVDANVGYTVASSYGKTTAGIGVVNAFDQKPPVIYSNITQWSDWNYDFLGRRYYFRLVHNY